jgi:hypothetical protein
LYHPHYAAAFILSGRFPYTEEVVMMFWFARLERLNGPHAQEAVSEFGLAG